MATVMMVTDMLMMMLIMAGDDDCDDEDGDCEESACPIGLDLIPRCTLLRCAFILRHLFYASGFGLPPRKAALRQAAEKNMGGVPTRGRANLHCAVAWFLARALWLMFAFVLLCAYYVSSSFRFWFEIPSI